MHQAIPHIEIRLKEGIEPNSPESAWCGNLRVYINGQHVVCQRLTFVLQQDEFTQVNLTIQGHVEITAGAIPAIQALIGASKGDA